MKNKTCKCENVESGDIIAVDKFGKCVICGNDNFMPINKAQQRKQIPVYSGLLMYFPDACRAVANLSFVANEQHNPGTKMHWDRSKSGDELDALTRHLLEAGTLDDDGMRHSTKICWRALANLQKEIENDKPKNN